MARSRHIALATLVALAQGCGGGQGGAAQHPLTNALDASYPTLNVRAMAALPFASDVRDDEDPDAVAAGMVEAKFYQALGATGGHTILPASEVARVIESQKLSADMASFYKKWIGDQNEIDTEFIQKVASAMRADAVVAGVVDVWHQQPVDITETGTARTTVGVLVGVFHGATGKRLWLGRDENFKEALRYSPNESDSELARTQTRGQMERSNLRTATGAYAPPDFAAVLDAVVLPLARAFPKPVQ
jgi:hypothetical protein